MPSCDGHDYHDIRKCIAAAVSYETKLSLICCKTKNGYPVEDRMGTPKAHGGPIGPDQVMKLREILNWPWAPFILPQQAMDFWKEVEYKNARKYSEWLDELKRDPILRNEFERQFEGTISKMQKKKNLRMIILGE